MDVTLPWGMTELDLAMSKEIASHKFETSHEYQANIDKLAGMGFTAEDCDKALRMSQNDVEKAIILLNKENDDMEMRSETRRPSAIFSIHMGGYVESDEEAVEAGSCNWREDDEFRVKCLMENFDRYIFYHKNGAFHRCAQIAYNIMANTPEEWVKCASFVDDTLSMVVTRHVNPSENVFIGPQEIDTIRELYHAVFPVLSVRLRFTPSVKVVLCIEEMLTANNKFMSSAKSSETKPEENVDAVWCDPALLEVEHPHYIFVEMMDDFVKNVIPNIDAKLESPHITVAESLFLLRSFSPCIPYLNKSNEVLRKKLDSWIRNCLLSLQTISDKEIRDQFLRRSVIELLSEAVKIGDQFSFDMYEMSQDARLDFLKKCIKCPQMECMLFAMEELGMLADSFSSSYMSITHYCVSESFLKEWLSENSVMQTVLTGNMDSACYVEKVRTILHYMTPDMKFNDIKFIWSLRKGRLGVSFENFNKIMDLILRAFSTDQLDWMNELFQKSVRNKEIRLFESIFGYCHVIAVSTKLEELKIKAGLMLKQLLLIAYGPPQLATFKVLELGIRKHIEILNLIVDKSHRERVLYECVDSVQAETFDIFKMIYLFHLLDKVKRALLPSRRAYGWGSYDRDMIAAWESLKLHLRETDTFERLLERLITSRTEAFNRFETEKSESNNSEDAIKSVVDTQVDGMASYGFVLDNYLRLLRWIVDNDAVKLNVDIVNRIWKVFVLSENSMVEERSKLFRWLSDFKSRSLPQEATFEVLKRFCSISPNKFDIDGLRCFTMFLESLPLYPDNYQSDEQILMLLKDCKLFFWKLVLFNTSEPVFERVVVTFCEREIVCAESNNVLKENTYHLLAVFMMYLVDLKKRYFELRGLKATPSTYSHENITLSEEDAEFYALDISHLKVDLVSGSIERLLRLLTRAIAVGNEKSHYVRMNPPHGSTVSGHRVVIEVLHDSNERYDRWNINYVDANSTLGELRARISRRLSLNRTSDFAMFRHGEDNMQPELGPKYDWMTLRQLKLVASPDSIYYCESIKIILRRRAGSKRGADCKRSLLEAYLPAALVQKCGFYDLLHDLCAFGSGEIQSSCRELLNIMPTQESLLEMLGTMTPYHDYDPDKSCDKLKLYKALILDLEDPYRMLYGLEALSAVLSPTRLTPKAIILSNRLSRAVVHADLYKWILAVLRRPSDIRHVHPKIRNAIFERLLQILKVVFIQRGNFIMAFQEEKGLPEFKKIFVTEPRSESEYDLKNVMDEHEDFINNPILYISNSLDHNLEIEDMAVCESWTEDECLETLTIIRDFTWLYIATGAKRTNLIAAHPEQEMDEGFVWPTNETASDLIRNRLDDEQGPKMFIFVMVENLMGLMFELTKQRIIPVDNCSLRFIMMVFIHPHWIRFYEDILVNTHNPHRKMPCKREHLQFRRHMSSFIKELSEDNAPARNMILKMLLGLFNTLPYDKHRTADLDALGQRQRANAMDLVKTINSCIMKNVDENGSEKDEVPDVMYEVDWSEVGFEPFAVVNQQMRSLMSFPTNFLQREESRINENYASAKMKLISTLLMCCQANQIKMLEQGFLEMTFSKFLFPFIPDAPSYSGLEPKTMRWEGVCRAEAVTVLTIMCSRNFRNLFAVLQMMEKNQTLARSCDPNYRAITKPRVSEQVGLKNDGGTCYMNAVIQQLVHVPGLATQWVSMKPIDPNLKWGSSGQYTSLLVVEMQKVISLLMFSRAQACVPHGLWKSFRFEPQVPLNTKQHHDAIDFYNCLLDRCDTVMQKLNMPTFFQQRFFGKFSYEKICYGCWHRYQSPDEVFNSISVALTGDTLDQSLDKFFDPHVMEGDGAYYCEKCNEKKTTLNLTAFRSLPPTLTIQLKRFQYDFINGQIKKDNQFFKFPMQIDLAPYMQDNRHVADEDVQDFFDNTLNVNTSSEHDETNSPNRCAEKEEAKTSGSAMPDSPQKKLRRHRSSTMRLSQSVGNGVAEPTPPQSCVYELVGVLAHSGIATAGHYYSFVKERREELKGTAAYGKWLQINDTLVSDLQMESVSDLWFGGTFNTDFELPEERIRHWNAYVLFYEPLENGGNGNGENIIEKPVEDNGEEDGLSFQAPKSKKIALSKEKWTEEDSEKERVSIFNKMHEGLKQYVTAENLKFFQERDFISAEYYGVLVNSCLEMLVLHPNVPYELTMPEIEFESFAFEVCLEYIVHVAWQMLDEIRPNGFPQNSADLLKGMFRKRQQHCEAFFKELAMNDFELLNRFNEFNEPEVRDVYYECIKCAVESWMAANNTPPQLIVESSDSSDMDDEEDDMDEETDSDDEFVDAKRTRAVRRKSSSETFVRVPEITGVDALRGIVKRFCLLITPGRVEYTGKNVTRHVVGLLAGAARCSPFGAHFLEQARVLDFCIECLFEHLLRFRYADLRLKQLGLWPQLPGLYAELLLTRLCHTEGVVVDQLMNTSHNLLMLLALYSALRIEERRNLVSERSISAQQYAAGRIVDCIVQQIKNLNKPSHEQDCHEYIVDMCQALLKEMTSQAQVMHEEHFSYVLQAVTEVAIKLHVQGFGELSVRLVTELLDVSELSGRQPDVNPGFFPTAHSLLQAGDHDRAKKLFNLLRGIQTCPVSEIAKVYHRCRHRYPAVFQPPPPSTFQPKMLPADQCMEQEMSDDDDRSTEKAGDDDQPPPLLEQQIDDVPMATATARVLECNELDLTRELQPEDRPFFDDVDY